MDSRPHLAPGLRVVRRGRDHLQVGLYDGRRVLLPRTEGVTHAIAMLLERGVLTTDADPAGAAALDELDRNGCLAWERPARIGRRAVAVLGQFEIPGLPDVGELLATADVAITSSTFRADVVLVLSPGEIDRDRLDPLIRSRASHLVVRMVDGGAVLGPFVVPGVTACLRCIDAHQSVLDPDHVAVTARYVRATECARPDGVPDLDPALTSVALSWAVRDVVAHLDGREPSTWSRTVQLAAEPVQRSEHAWLRHPRCGCSWPTQDLADC